MFLSRLGGCRRPVAKTEGTDPSMTMAKQFGPLTAALVVVLFALTMISVQVGANAEPPTDTFAMTSTPGSQEGFAIVEIRIRVPDVTEFHGLPAWHNQPGRDSILWSIRGDLYRNGRGFAFIEVYDETSSRAASVVPLAGDATFVPVLPVPERYIDPERRDALLRLNDTLPSLFLQISSRGLAVADCDPTATDNVPSDDTPSSAGAPPVGTCDGEEFESVRFIVPGDTLRNARWPEVEITSHPSVPEVLAFRIFIDYAPPGED